MIMVADDERDSAELLKHICERDGYQVILAEDGLQAVDIAHEHLPDIILLDVQMPKLDGFGVVTQLRTTPDTEQIPIIIITAAARNPEDAAKGIDIGADDYLYKPFNYHELMARVRAKLKARELEMSLHKRTNELDMLVRLGVNLNQSNEVLEIAEDLLRFLQAELAIQYGIVFVDTPRENTADDAHPILIRLHNADILTTRATPGILLDFLTIQPHEPRFLAPAHSQQLFEHVPVPSAIISFLIHKNTTLGLLIVGRLPDSPFSLDDVRVINSINRQVSLAIRNAQLYDALRNYADELEARVEERTRRLQSAQEQLIRSEKLASLGRLSGEIAHEINNPLQPIMVSLEDAIADLESGQTPTPQDLEIALSEVMRLQRIVRRLQDFARPDIQGMANINISALIGESLALTQKKIAHNAIDLIADLQPNLHITANSDQIKQVMLNMIINAVDAMGPHGGGTLTVQLERHAGVVQIRIADTGIGIDQESINVIFEPFYSTKENGSGIGLAVSYSIIEAHGGRVNVESIPNEGTCFTIELPYIPANGAS